MQIASRLIRLMGTRIETKIWHDTPELILDQVEELLYLYQNRFSANDLTSELMEVNLNAGVQPVPVSQDLYDLIVLGKEHSVACGSFLNITIGPLVQAWRIGFKDAKRPSQKLIDEKLKLISPKDIDLNPDRQEVYLRKEGMAIDLGALAKGYVADQLVAFLEAMGVRTGYINLGGNVKTFGQPFTQNDKVWRIGIQDPQGQKGDILATVCTGPGSFVTSGTYERVLEVDGESYHHILDSDTGYPIVSTIQSLTIYSSESIDGEIWSSRLFGHHVETIYETIEEQAGIDAIIVDRQGQLYASSGLVGKIETDRPIRWSLESEPVNKQNKQEDMQSDLSRNVDVSTSASQGGFGVRQWSGLVTGASVL